MKRKVTFGILLIGALAAMGQPRYKMETISREKLNRGVVAIRDGQNVVVSWRTLTSDAPGEAFDLFRNGTKLNNEPIYKGGTFFIDSKNGE